MGPVEQRRNPERAERNARKAALGARQARKAKKVGRVMAKLNAAIDRLGMEKRFAAVKAGQAVD